MAGGECLTSLEEGRDWLEHQPFATAQLGASFMSGRMNFMKIARLCELRGVAITWRRRAVIWFVGVVAAQPAMQATPVPSHLFSDRAVLQRGMPVPVWGKAAPGEKVVVRYRAMSASTVTGADGRWSVELPPMAACASADLVIAGESTIVAREVGVGDVWLLTGQSNMEWPLEKTEGVTEAVAAAELPWLRHFKVPHHVADAPGREVAARWISSSPDSVPAFSAVGFHFARQLYRDGGVPVGLLNVSRGGSVIEGWMSPRARTAAGETASSRETRADARGSGLYHGMIAPVVPFAVRGVIWYQGESNVTRPGEYAGLLAALIDDWRREFAQPRLPFLVVQLPNYADGKFAWWELREAQARVAAEMPHTHLAVTIDLGEARDKHPRDKLELGRRLALLARRYVFGEAVVAEAPRVRSVARRGVEAVVEFEAADGELVLHPPRGEARSLEIADRDGRFVDASARLEGGFLVMRAESVSEPQFVRYLAHNDPEPRIFTRGGLPVAPFRAVVK